MCTEVLFDAHTSETTTHIVLKIIRYTYGMESRMNAQLDIITTLPRVVVGCVQKSGTTHRDHILLGQR